MIDNAQYIENKILSSKFEKENSENQDSTISFKDFQSSEVSKNLEDSLELSNEAKAGKKEEKSISEKEKQKNNGELTEQEQEIVNELKKIDRETRAHEQAHLAAAAGLNASGPFYEYTTGPDNKQYAVGGEVQIDNSPVPGDPEATIRKMRQVQAAALAPAEPSAQDRSVAAKAQQTMAKAQAELTQKNIEESKENTKALAKPIENPAQDIINVEYKSPYEAAEINGGQFLDLLL